MTTHLKLKTSRSINEIIVHCAATPEGKNFTVEQIRNWHVNGRGWKDIGYHFVIYLDGSIHAGRPVEQVGAHCLNHNQHSIGVCYIGGCTAEGKKAKDTRTPAQKKALLELLTELRSIYPKARIHSHSDFANKACPAFNATQEYASL
ncbi:N-acetylmuramoyl-L-alanine amidase [Sodaliphilus sp.]|uniref:N-acetylmuramoyl-L-alanine amidase n=1 Tax=Sodaliphilus sp. TaxID=2815818 RepID=UPI00388E095D